MRGFDEAKHLLNMSAVEYQALHDEFGNVLEGIRGKALACGQSNFSDAEIGVDLIEMTSGSAFPLHVHPGDHCLVVLKGRGVVTIDDKRYQVRAGDSIYIAAEFPHAVSAPESPMAFLAFGHPHKHVAATDRMKLVESA